jgi:hypothetical protein
MKFGFFSSVECCDELINYQLLKKVPVNCYLEESIIKFLVKLKGLCLDYYRLKALCCASNYEIHKCYK